MISTGPAWMAPVPGRWGWHVMAPISDERSSRMWWLPLVQQDMCRAAGGTGASTSCWGSLSGGMACWRRTNQNQGRVGVLTVTVQ